MKYCQNCGSEIDDNAVICVKCGCAIPKARILNLENVDESVSVGLVVLAVLIPLFGFIYWPVKAKERPKCAKACGIAAIISFVIGLLLVGVV